jgi:hypothetical protein
VIAAPDGSRYPFLSAYSGRCGHLPERDFGSVTPEFDQFPSDPSCGHNPLLDQLN